MNLLWSLLAVAASVSFVEAVEYDVIKEFSIGARYPISNDHETIPGFTISGTPQLLSDRIILTPPTPGNQRVGLWTTTANQHGEWMATIEFRVSGSERPGGSFHLWYTSRGKNGGSGTGQDVIYTSKPWDGLALVIDSHSGTSGIRAYLNDGTKDYSQHHDPVSLAFAHCDFDYRNKGALSKVVLTQDSKTFKAEVDGKLCFQTDKVRVPTSYFFGITAATSETPDSFELFKFTVSAPPNDGSKTREEPKIQQQGTKQQQQQQQHNLYQKPKYQQHDPLYERTSGKLPHEEDFEEWHPEAVEEEHDASFYSNQDEQFMDLHNRLQALTHHLADIQNQVGMVYDRIDSLHHKDDEFRAEWRNTRMTREQIDKIDKIDRRLGAIEKLSTEIAGAMTSKDYTLHFEELRKTLNEHHSNLLYSVPDSVHQVLAHGGPRIGMMVTIVVLVQVALAVAYVIYKRRRNSSPKKYL
ncbi:concanavalin A-like lectin/glucanase [Wilcoxina mikolae CBS 423.85]|nr:concanavalin A-like lectin/glucanase [Wilcoxina mikolae CBS 423.85]